MDNEGRFVNVEVEDKGSNIIFNKILDKLSNFFAETNIEPKYVIIDSQSYLYLDQYFSDLTHSREETHGFPDMIYTQFGPIKVIPIPMMSERIYVTDGTIATAVETIYKKTMT
jgi:hypothetical protein